ncbi:MAG: L,D-transpeptidase [Elusimicrobiales bacterium]|nr:L,D-transpeptidase [Elusimicrobiales bacterium]
MKLIPAVFGTALLCAAAACGYAGGSFDELSRTAGPKNLEAAESLAVPSLNSVEASVDTWLIDKVREAKANPDKFIDEEDSDVVGLVFGLPDSIQSSGRFPVPLDIAQKAAVRITVDLARQRLTVVSADLNGTFPISSGAAGHRTPGRGNCYAPDFLDASHRSSLYGNAPMPNAVFFNGNIAIHATEHEDLLGQPASHGCVRVSLATSKLIFPVVKKALAQGGKTNASVCLEGYPPK